MTDTFISIPIVGGTITVDETTILAALAGAKFVPTQVVSPDKTTITTVGPEIQDKNGNTWGLSTSKQVVCNGVIDTNTWNVITVAYVGGEIWHENSDNPNHWYWKIQPTDKWSAGTTTNPITGVPGVLPAPTPPTGLPTTSTMTAAQRKAAILAELNLMRGAKWMPGQTTEIFIWPRTMPDALSVAQAPLAAINPATGKDVAIASVIINCGNYLTNGAYDLPTGKALAQALWKKGALVHASWYPSVPTSNSSANATADGGVAPGNTALDQADFHACVTPGTTQYANMETEIDYLVAQIRDWCVGGNVMILRPFIEENGAWNWFGSQTPSDMKALQQMVHAKLQAGGVLDNVIYEFNVNPYQADWHAYDPGPGIRDVVSFDPYGTVAAIIAGEQNDKLYADMAAFGCPLFLAEVATTGTMNPGKNALNDLDTLNVIRQNMPDVVAAIFWCQGCDIANGANAKAMMADPSVVTLSDLPQGLGV